MEEYSKEQIEQWKAKAEKWDSLAKEIEKCYYNEDGSENENSDLCTIGEYAAYAFGWL